MSKYNQPIFQRIIDRLKIDSVTGCWNWQGCNRWGYGKITINKKTLCVHRVMYKIFYGSIPEDKPLVLHKCDNPKCCNPMHLYAGTQQDNMNDRVKRNQSCKGENHHNVKLTEKQVLEIRASSDMQIVLAQRFNVGRTIINDIKNRKRWKHIK